MYWSTHTRFEKSEGVTGGVGSGASIPSSTTGIDGVDVLEAAVGAVSSLANQGLIDESSEAKLIQQAFQRNPDLIYWLQKKRFPRVYWIPLDTTRQPEPYR